MESRPSATEEVKGGNSRRPSLAAALSLITADQGTVGYGRLDDVPTFTLCATERSWRPFCVGWSTRATETLVPFFDQLHGKQKQEVRYSIKNQKGHLAF